MEPPDVFVLCVLFVMLMVSLSVLAAGEASVQAKPSLVSVNVLRPVERSALVRGRRSARWGGAGLRRRTP